MVVTKIDNISPEKLESLLHQNLAKEFRLLLAGSSIIGLLIGLLQLVIIALAD